MLSPEIVQIMLPVLGLVVTILCTMAERRFAAWTGIQIEAKHREALQSALTNAGQLAINKFALDRPADQPITPAHTPILQTIATEYVRKSVPDAINFFGLTPEKLGEMVLTKLVLPRLGL